MRYTTVAIIACAFCLAALVEPAMAAPPQEASSWREIWDLAWRFINFLILAVIIYKLAKQPLMDFLRGQHDMVEVELRRVEKAKNKALAELREIEEKTAGLARELEEYEGRITRRAERERKRIMEDAALESKLLVERAELWAHQTLAKAKAKLADEILAMAQEMAAEKILANITSQDQDKMFSRFTEEIAGGNSA